MKLVIAIVQNDDERTLLSKLMEGGYRATKLATTGGFLKTGNTTFMIGIEDEKLNNVINIINNTCRSRMVTMPSYPYSMEPGVHATYPVKTRVGGATVFVLPIEQNLSL